jgi:HprK-related kinase B
MPAQEIETLSTLGESLLSSVADLAALHLHFGGIDIRLLSNEPQIVAELRDYFREFLAKETVDAIDVIAIEGAKVDFKGPFVAQDREAGKTGLKECYCDLPDGRVVHKVRTGMYFAFGAGLNLALGPCLKNLPQIVNFINSRVLELYLLDQGVLGHASGVVYKGQAIAFCGFAGAGKSTMALHLMSNFPVSLLSNDRIVLRREGTDVRALGIAKHPRINPGTILSNPALTKIIEPEKKRTLEALAPDDLWELEDKYDCVVHDIFGTDRFVMQARLRALFFLCWDRHSSEPLTITRIDIDERRELLAALMKRPGLFFQVPNGMAMPTFETEDYLDILRECDLYEVRGAMNLEGLAAMGREILGPF